MYSLTVMCDPSAFNLVIYMSPIGKSKYKTHPICSTSNYILRVIFTIVRYRNKNWKVKVILFPRLNIINVLPKFINLVHFQ